MTRALAATLFAALLLVPAPARTHGVREGGTLHVATVTGDITSADPALPSIFASLQLLRPVCRAPLAYPDKPLPRGLRIAPDLAEALPRISKDGRTYRFTIRRYVRFSTGTAVTAPDSCAHSKESSTQP